jgi:hypothetical protein
MQESPTARFVTEQARQWEGDIREIRRSAEPDGKPFDLDHAGQRVGLVGGGALEANDLAIGVVASRSGRERRTQDDEVTASSLATLQRPQFAEIPGRPTLTR